MSVTDIGFWVALLFHICVAWCYLHLAGSASAIERDFIRIKLPSWLNMILTYRGRFLHDKRISGAGIITHILVFIGIYFAIIDIIYRVRGFNHDCRIGRLEITFCSLLLYSIAVIICGIYVSVCFVFIKNPCETGKITIRDIIEKRFVNISNNVKELLETYGTKMTEDECYLKKYEFKDTKTAIVSFFGRGEITQRNFQETKIIINSPYLLIFSPGCLKGLPLVEPQIPILCLFMFKKRENGKVSPITSWVQNIHMTTKLTREIQSDEERIVKDIAFSYIYEELTSRANKGIPIYYGIGIGKHPVRISILGLEPDEIIPFEFMNKQYFFWYYLSAPQFGEIFSKNIDSQSPPSSDIDLFNIKVRY